MSENGKNGTSKLLIILITWILSLAVPVTIGAIAYGKLQGKVDELERIKADIACVAEMKAKIDIIYTNVDEMKKDFDKIKKQTN